MLTLRIVSLAVLTLVTSPIFAQAKAGHPAGGEHPAAEVKAPSYVIADVDGKKQVMTKGDFSAAEKKAADEYAAALAQFEKDKKAAAEAKKPFEHKAPEKAKLSAHGNFPTQAAAQEALQKAMAEHDKPKAPKADAPHKPAEAPKKKK